MPQQPVDGFGAPSFSLANRMARAAWGIVYITLFRLSPRPFHAWRAFLLRVFGAKLGARCHIYPRAIIWAPWNIICGDESAVGDGAILYSQAIITIGKRVVISQGSHVCTGTHDYESRSFPLIAKPIAICDHAWIAAEAFIHPGVTIAEGAVIGARSVVTKDMPAWTVCAGHPCEPIKPRKFRD